MASTLKVTEAVLKVGTGVACAYEAVALATGVVPTISKEVGLHAWIGPLVLVGLALHFYFPQAVAVFKKIVK